MSNKSVKTVGTRIWAASSDDEIVISGISGKFPNSKNLTEFSYNLYNKVKKYSGILVIVVKLLVLKNIYEKFPIIKVDMVDARQRRWPDYNTEIPVRMGTIDDIEKFDATFFGVPFKQTNSMDPQCRLLIETAYEAIVDAGVCPKMLRGSKTGVFIGACFGESEKTFFYDQVTPSGLGITGYVVY